MIGAEQQYITYKEFLPALGVSLPAYQGYKDNVNASLGNEFATVGYRAHSMIHGELEAIGEAADYTAAQLAAIEAQGVEVEEEGDEVEFVIPLNLAFGNPDLLKLVGVGAVLHGLGGEPEYKNDEMIDNQLRSVLFQVPVPGNEGCLDGPTLPACFKGVVDLGAIDIERARDHGMPLYNDLRRAFGLSAKTSFTSITGESTDKFPTNDPKITGNPINDPNILDFVEALRRRRESDRARYPGGRCRGSRRRSPHDPRRAAEGDLRRSEQARRVRRNALRAARARLGVRRAAACDVEAAVPGAA